MGSKLGGGDDDAIVDINITPFVDIILVVLIIFMVTATTIAKQAIKVNLPEAATGETADDTSLALVLEANGSLLLDGEPTTENALRNFIRAERTRLDAQGSGDIVCLIAADDAVPHGQVIHLIDLVKQEGVAKFALNIAPVPAPPQAAGAVLPPKAPQSVSTYPWEEDERTRLRGVLGLIVAVLLHAVAAYAIARIKPLERIEEVWIEMTVTETLPEPEEAPPEALPEPEPKKQAPRKKQPVDFEDTVDQVTPDAPEEAPPDQPVRRIQGLSASSFAVGAGTNFAVRAGTSLQTAATDETMGIDEATVRFSAVTSQPKLRWKPPLAVPEAARDAGIEGVIEVLLTLDAEGQVVDAQIVRGLGYGTDEACIAAWRQARFKPAMQGAEAVGVRNVPYRCRVEIVP